VVVAEARADLPEAEDPAEHLEQARAVVVRPLQARLLEEAGLEVGRLEVELVEVLAVAVPAAQAERLVALEEAAVAARTPSSIPRMAKFPTRQQLARSPTT
jgi:hypothetical protein